MANKSGEVFLSEVREIIELCSAYKTPARAAYLTALGLLLMLDGSGEHIGNQYRIVTESGEPVEFLYGEL